jgi:hypothetical protein
MTILNSRTLTISIAAPPERIYEFVVDPSNLPQWAPGFAQSVRRDGSQWIVETTDGPMDVEFAPINQFGVADHTVVVSPGSVVTNYVRIVPNGDGAEVLFTFLQTPDLADEQFEAASALVFGDLHILKRLMEPEQSDPQPS